MIKINYIILLCLLVVSCHSQTKNSPNTIIGGPCEGCEAIHEYDTKLLTSIDTIVGFYENEPKLKIEGTIYKLDGNTPAADVILYIYHTNRNGIYETKGDEEGWAKRHGIYRGWIKTDNKGKYTFYTFKPAAYPNGIEPEHIHMTIKEPDKNEYYIDVIAFDDDPRLTPLKRSELEKRGGSGIVYPKVENGIQVVNRNIILGHNIPNYP